jgi:hypothetical protein
MNHRLRDVFSFMSTPSYSYPPGVLAALTRDILLLRRRDFHQDAQAFISRLDPPLQILGAKNIPRSGACTLTVNHYHRPGFRAQWLALAISALVPVPIHWIVTAEFRYEGKWFQPVGSFLSRILLRRIAHMYGFTCMPSMPPHPAEVQARASAVRAVLEVVKNTREPVLGLALEGYDASDKGVIMRPPAGVGRFGLLLARTGLRFVPVGVYEADGSFHLRFGESYALNVSPDLSADEKDLHASQIMMEHIAILLPQVLRGAFA